MSECKCENVTLYDGVHRCVLCFKQFYSEAEAVRYWLGIDLAAERKQDWSVNFTINRGVYEQQQI